MANSAKKGYMGSTEPQAREVVEGIKKRQPKKKVAKKSKLSPTKQTAKTPAGVAKSKAQGKKELTALRKKQQARVKAAQAKQKRK